MEFSEASSMYLDHFGLRHDPFSETPPGFVFQHARRRSVIEQLVHFARYGNFLLLVTGPQGSGKTVLRRALVASAKDSAINLVISGHHSQDPAAIMQNLAAGLKTANASVEGLLEAITQAVATGHEVHILVDDAQLLDEAAIMLLQRLAGAEQSSRAAVYLFGTPALETLVKDVEKNTPDSSNHLITLEPWNETEIEDYLRNRLAAAGRDLDIFTEQELLEILQGSGGWPGVANQLARDKLMARMFDRPKRRALPPLPYKYIAILFVLAFAMVFIWYWQDEKPQDKQTTVLLPNSVERPMVSSQRLGTNQTQPPALQQPVQQQEAWTQQQSQQQPVETTPTQPVEPVVEALSEPKALEPVVTEPVLAEVEPAKPEPEKPVSLPKPTTKPVQAKPTQAKPAPSKPVTAKVTQAKTATRQPRSWYHQQPAQNFTLQLMASSNLDSVRSFANTDPQYHYFRKQHQGKYLYVLTYGSFTSREQALAVQSRLPAQLRSNKPWPRTFSSIVQEIR